MGTFQVYDSGSVASGAQIQTPIMDLGGPDGFDSIQIVIDNTAGTVLRDLTMESYLADASTVIDSVVIRRVAFGTAPTGSTYAPGRVRGYVGPTPPGGVTGSHLLYDATSAANAALDTGALSTEDADHLDIVVTANGGTTTCSPYITLDDGTFVQAGTAPGAAIGQNGMWGAGTTAIGTISAAFALPRPVPRRARFTTTAAGVGFTVRALVYGRGRVPGTFSVQMALPPYVRLTLGAAGAGAARLTVYGQ